MSASPPWLVIGLRELGVAEIHGSPSNSRILEYDQATTLKATARASVCADGTSRIAKRRAANVHVCSLGDDGHGHADCRSSGTATSPTRVAGRLVALPYMRGDDWDARGGNYGADATCREDGHHAIYAIVHEGERAQSDRVACRASEGDRASESMGAHHIHAARLLYSSYSVIAGRPCGVNRDRKRPWGALLYTWCSAS